MPLRILRDVLVVDHSMLARNMHQLLFSAQTRFHVRFADEFENLFKKSGRLRPDLLIINSNALGRSQVLNFPCPTILILSKDRMDLKEQGDQENVIIIEKPFYPYDLISVANRLIANAKKRSPRRRRGV